MIYVLVCVRDEEQDLTRMLRGLREVSWPSRERYRVIVVDDGSRDESRLWARAFARDFDLSLVSHPESFGAGVAIRTGLKLVLAEAEPDDVVVVTAAGAGHDLAVVPELARAMRRKPAGVAVHSSHPNPAGQAPLANRSLLRRGYGRGLRLNEEASAVQGQAQADPGPTAFRVGALQEARETAGRDIPVAEDCRGAAELVMRVQREGESVTNIGPSPAHRIDTDRCARSGSRARLYPRNWGAAGGRRRLGHRSD